MALGGNPFDTKINKKCKIIPTFKWFSDGIKEINSEIYNYKVGNSNSNSSGEEILSQRHD